MQLNDEALILKVDPFRERDALISVFGRKHGLLRGIVRSGLSSKQRSTYQIGNWIELEWKARLEEHLGSIRADLLSASGAMIVSNRQRCYALQSVCALLLMCFEQRDPHPKLYQLLEKLIMALRVDTNWAADYARFEAVLLQETGFGLGLERCIVTGQSHELHYVSPKSGCAVSKAEGTPYHDKLFHYPALLMQDMHMPADARSVVDALDVTGHFLQQWLFAALEKSLPQSRSRLLAALEKDCVALALHRTIKCA